MDGYGPDASRGVTTLVALLRAQAERHGRRRFAIFLGEEGFEGPSLDRAELDLRARALAVRLLGRGLQPGDRVLLVHPPGLEFIVGFFGCLYAGLCAVPVCPPAPPFERTLGPLQAIARKAEPAAVLTTAAMARALRPSLAAAGWPSASDLLLASDSGETPPELAEVWRDPATSPDAPAFLQFTSGSTSAPKGVVVTHGNVLANQRMIQEAFRLPEGARFASWLPHFHDMGLVGNLLQPLWLGGEVALLSPLTFLGRPRRWLEVITHFRTQASAAPTFAYELCVRRIPPEAREGLELGSWGRAMCGAEPVRPEAMDRFVEAFAPFGLDPAAFAPCYDLAEATLLVSGAHAGRARRLRLDRAALEAGRVARSEGAGTLELLSNGAPPEGLEIHIADPGSGAALEVGNGSGNGNGEEPAVGEVWVRGASVAAGYHDDPDQSLATFGARSSEGQGPFLRTGDLGFLHDGELFLCGRLKDLLVVRGRNIAPQDIEALATSAHPAVRPGGVAAFALLSVSGGEPRVALVAEVRAARPDEALDAASILGDIREAVARGLRLSPHVVALVAPGSVPRTSSGKIRRAACRAAYVAGRLELLAHQETKEIP